VNSVLHPVGSPPADVQAAHGGSALVPPRTRSTRSQRDQRARRCSQAPHQGWPVAWEITHGAWRPQIPQVADFCGRQLGHNGPSGVRAATGRRRSQPAQVSWLTGSVIRQCGHSGRPSPSRVAGSPTVPHREHGSARDLATQLRHSRIPSRGLTSGITRPQRGQGGRTMPSAPASQSRSTSRSTDGTGAAAPGINPFLRVCHERITRIDLTPLFPFRQVRPPIKHRMHAAGHTPRRRHPMHLP
jgi:hypothetical protein